MRYTLGYYFNKDNRGPNSAYQGIAAARASILNNIRNTKRINDVNLLSQQLNDFFYPKIEESKGRLINFNELLTDAFWGGWERSGAKSRIGVSIDTAPDSKAKTRKVNRAYAQALKDASSRLKNDYSMVTQLMGQGNLPKLLEILERIDNDTDIATKNLTEIIDSIAEEITHRSSFGQDWKSIDVTLKKRFGVKNSNGGRTYYNREYIKELAKALDELLLYFQKDHVFTTKDAGDIFEYAIALFNSDLKKAGQLGAADLQDYLVKNFVKGATQATRKYKGILNLSNVDIPQHYIERNKKGEITKQIYNFGGIEVEHYANLEVEDAKQSKVDVTLNNGVGASLKNWSSLDLVDYSTGGRRKRDFGTTTLLRAISRTSGALQQYIWALQTTYGKNGYNPEKLLQHAHYFAKMSIYADILMGLGFDSKDYHAGTIIINSRADKKIIVFNAATEILKALNDTGTSRIAIEGYNQEELRSVSRTFMETVKSGRAIDRSNMYTTVMQDFLNGQKIKVVYNNYFDF